MQDVAWLSAPEPLSPRADPSRTSETKVHVLLKNWTQLFQPKAHVFVPSVTCPLQNFVRYIFRERGGGFGEGYVKLSSNPHHIRREGGFRKINPFHFLVIQRISKPKLQLHRTSDLVCFQDKDSTWRRRKQDNYYKIREIHLKTVKILSFATEDYG